MSETEPWTILRLLQWTTDYLKKQGSESPRLDAEVLLSHARKCRRIELYTAYSEEPNEEIRGAFRELVKRRATGTPVAYLVGKKEFYSLNFKVTPDVLIPRPETEHVVVEAIDRIKELSAKLPAQGNQSWNIADICTGSGNIAISLAKHIQNAKIVATDISPPALQIAKENAASIGVADRITFLQGDLLSTVPPGSKFHLILSNPPYVSQAEYDALPKSVKDFEPKQALLSGPTGTEIIDRLVEESESRLTAGGYLIIELSPMLAKQVAASLESRTGWQPQVVKDLAARDRLIVAQRN